MKEEKKTILESLFDKPNTRVIEVEDRNIFKSWSEDKNVINVSVSKELYYKFLRMSRSSNITEIKSSIKEIGFNMFANR